MSVESFHSGRVILHGGDCLDALAGFEAGAVDAVVTDPPYELGFMARAWDRSGIAFRPETWAAIGRVMKPGAHLVAFGAPKNFHRMVCAIEDAGFEVRDCIFWVFGSGYPKSMDVSKAIDKAAGAKRELGGYRSKDHAIKRKPARERQHEGWTRPFMDDPDRYDASLRVSEPATADAARWQGWGTALKPAYEPICLARWPLSEKTVAANVLRHGTGALNIDACRVEMSPEDAAIISAMMGFGRAGYRSNRVALSDGSLDKKVADSAAHPLGRWPANVCHDGSAEVVEAFPKTAPAKSRRPRSRTKGVGWGMTSTGAEYDDDGGSAARFFYSAKADADDRLGSKHPTVKPVALMQWLVRMVCPKGGLVLDPFAGTGTTGEAALREGMRAALIERESEHIADIARRMRHVFDGETGRKVARVKATAAGEDHGPLFAPQDDGAPAA